MGYEEKQTDVNIGIYLLKEAVKNTYDTADKSSKRGFSAKKDRSIISYE